MAERVLVPLILWSLTLAACASFPPVDRSAPKKPFTGAARARGIDSTFALGYAGRTRGATFEVRELHYDSSPSGTGRDPMWLSASCNPLYDARRACDDPRIIQQHEGMGWFCEAYKERSYPGNPLRSTALQLGLFCAGEADFENCADGPRL